MPEIKDQAQLVLQLRRGAAYLQKHLDCYSGLRPADYTALKDLMADALLAALQLAREDWRPVSEPPATLPAGEHFSVSVLGVVDDPALRMPGEQPFVDIVAWWPALKRWTITHQSRSDDVVEDFEVRITCWRPLPCLPPRGTP